MRTTYQFLGFDPRGSSYRMLEQHVDYWQHLTAVAATEVVIERQPQAGPAFRVQARLEVPGGHLQAEAVARTFKAALLRASTDLETQIEARKARRLERRASNPHSAPAAAGGFILTVPA